MIKFELFVLLIAMWLLYRKLIRPFLRGMNGMPRSGSMPNVPPMRSNMPPVEPKMTSRIDRTKVEDADYRDIG